MMIESKIIVFFLEHTVKKKEKKIEYKYIVRIENKNNKKEVINEKREKKIKRGKNYIREKLIGSLLLLKGSTLRPLPNSDLLFSRSHPSHTHTHTFRYSPYTLPYLRTEENN